MPIRGLDLSRSRQENTGAGRRWLWCSVPVPSSQQTRQERNRMVPNAWPCLKTWVYINVSIFKEQTHALLIALAPFCNMTSLTYGSLLHCHGRSVDCKGAANQAGMWGFCTLQGIEYALKRLSKGYIVQVRCWEFSFEISNTFIEKCCQKPSCWSQMSQSKFQGQCWKASLCRARHSFDARAFRVRQPI